MIKRIFSWFGYVPKSNSDVPKRIIDLENKSIKQQKELRIYISELERKVKKLIRNNNRLLKKQGEFKERIKELEGNSNVYKR